MKIEGGKRIAGLSESGKIFSNSPLITIATVVFNGENNIERTIQSVVSMSTMYSNIEYIVVDGGSKDLTIEILKRYNNFIEYWVSSPDSGIYDAMNKAWEIADSHSHILYLGAGDLIYSLPQMSEISSNKAIYGTVRVGDSVFFKSSPDWKLKLGNSIHHQALLIHKSLSAKPPFNTKYKAYADFDFNARLFNEGIKFFFSESFSAYALPGGLTNILHLQESLDVVEKNFGYFWRCLAALYYFISGLRNDFFRRVSKFSR